MIFVDAGPLIARAIRNDQHHEKAVRIWKRLQRANERYLTTPQVLAEVLNFIAHKATFHLAAEHARAILSSKLWDFARPDGSQELEALALFERYAKDPRADVSWTDALSFVVMRRRGLDRAFSFDAHFQSDGFELLS